jgi:hypothetical protein
MGPLFFVLIAMLVVKVFGQLPFPSQVTFKFAEGQADTHHPLYSCDTDGGYPKMDCSGTTAKIYVDEKYSSYPSSKQQTSDTETANFFKYGLTSSNMICSNYAFDKQPHGLSYAMRGLPVTFVSRGGDAVTVKLNFGMGGGEGVSGIFNFWIGGSDCHATADWGVLTCDGTYSDGSPAKPAVWFNWKKELWQHMEFEAGVIDRQPTPQPTHFPTPAPTTHAPTADYHPECLSSLPGVDGEDLEASHKLCKDHYNWLTQNWNTTFAGEPNVYEKAGVDGSPCSIVNYLSNRTKEEKDDTWCLCQCPQ